MNSEYPLVDLKIQKIEHQMDKLIVLIADLRTYLSDEKMNGNLIEKRELFKTLSAYSHQPDVEILRMRVVQSLKNDGYSQLAISEILEVNQSTVSRWLTMEVNEYVN